MVLEKSAEEAWDDLKKANEAKDFDAFKIVFLPLYLWINLLVYD